MPVFLFWFVIMLLIWLFLLGIARIASGHYSPTEIVLTLVMAIACLAGFVPAVRMLPPGRRCRGIALAVGFFVFQYCALWLTYLPFFPRG